ncbi:MMPL family transporter [Nakamurella leprariae]|uniref:MMPL family transporter n=1 Tax=Nakamurella leprariae TaxID=2803911 RepID=A0A939BY87_9ACTN|nr:MMPL family transporter [Nakamurella leprariae]MBM9469313.1 MMPL family transporter [Nakamurella leprariae]
MARVLARLGAFAHRRRWWVVVVWVVLLLGGGVGALTLAGTTSNSFSIPGQESTEALERINAEFGAGGGASATVVVQAPDGQTLTDPAHAAEVADLVAALNELSGVASATDPLSQTSPSIDPTLRTASSTVTYLAGVGEVTATDQDALLAALDDARATGLTVEVTGEAVAGGVPLEPIGEVVGVIVALLVLAITYGSLVAAGMTLVTAGVGVGLGVIGITITTGFVDLASTTTALAGMLGLAVGIDYALFIVNRFRQELRSGAAVPAAVATAVGTAGSAVVTAGVTVVIALAGLAVVGIPFLTQMGLAAAATIVVAVAVAITLVPAVLSLMGVRALPKRQRQDPTVSGGRAEYGRHAAPAGPGFLAGWVTTVTRRRVLSLLLTIVTLGVISLPFFSMQTTLAQRPAADSTQAKAEQLLAGAFGEGFNGPLIVLFEGSGSTDALEAAASSTERIAALTDVAAVAPAVPNADGSAALMTVIPRSGPSTPETQALVTDLRAALADTPGAQVSITGQTAVSVDVSRAVNDALPVYLVLVVGLAFILLVLVFRSLLVPLVGVVGFILTLGASLGATVAVFQWGWLADLVGLDSTGPLISLTPILVIGILFGLAMDYQVFLVSRMHEAHSHGEAPVAAIRKGFRQAAPVVVAAALIMFGVFAGFAASDDATLKSIAFALAAGILFDAFVVRMILVPAALALLGEKAWWLPRWLGWLPVLDVEGAALERELDGQGGRNDRTADVPDPELVGSR